MSIDLPIVLAILLGSAASIANLWMGVEHVYFDSLAALVFLLLASRYILRRVQQNAFHTSHLFQFLSPSTARRVEANSGSVSEVAVSALRIGDTIEVGCGEVLPVDGSVRSGAGAVNCALLTGESRPQEVSSGDPVFSGTVNEGAVLRIEVTATGPQTRLGQILKQVETGSLQKARIVTTADKTAKWFLVAVFVAAIAVILLAPNLADGFSRALALVIVTCPCALALATPLAMSVSLGRASKAGILIKGPDVLEKLTQAKKIVFDKTGTLTMGHFEVLQWLDTEQVGNLKEIVWALESKSKHPIAKAIVAFIKPRLSLPIPEVENFKEVIGNGVQGTANGRQFVMRPLRDAEGTAVGIYCDGVLAGSIHLGDRLRPESKHCVAKLRKFGLTPFVVSGDSRGAVTSVSEQIGIPFDFTLACADPETKRDFIARHDHCLMVGDGANDALALSTAFVGIAVHGSMEVSLRAADVYLTNPGIAPVVQLIRIARETVRTIHRNFAFSLLYNIVGGLAAATGHVTPLFAAILMPLSAFTVFSSSLAGTSRLRAVFKARIKA